MNTESGKERKNYYITKDIMSDWSSASKYCEERGMNLATFESFEEANYFNSIAGKEVWVGITDAVKEGEFIQVTGTPAPSLPWNAGEPNDYENNEDCVQSGYDGGFNDHDCSLVMRFACEKYEEVDENDKKHRFV